MDDELYTLEEQALALQNAPLVQQQHVPLLQQDVPLQEEQAPLHRVAVDLGEKDEEDMLVDVHELLNDQGQAQGQAKQRFKLDEESREFFACPIMESEIGLNDGKLSCCLPTYSLTCLPGYLLTCLPTYLLTYLPAYLLTCLPTCLLTYLPTCLLTYLPTYLIPADLLT